MHPVRTEQPSTLLQETLEERYEKERKSVRALKSQGLRNDFLDLTLSRTNITLHRYEVPGPDAPHTLMASKVSEHTGSSTHSRTGIPIQIQDSMSDL